MERLSSTNNKTTFKIILSFIFVFVAAQIYFGFSYLIDFESIGGDSLYRFHQTKRFEIENANQIDFIFEALKLGTTLSCDGHNNKTLFIL